MLIFVFSFFLSVFSLFLSSPHLSLPPPSCLSLFISLSLIFCICWHLMKRSDLVILLPFIQVYFFLVFKKLPFFFLFLFPGEIKELGDTWAQEAEGARPWEGKGPHERAGEREGGKEAQGVPRRLRWRERRSQILQVSAWFEMGILEKVYKYVWVWLWDCAFLCL